MTMAGTNAFFSNGPGAWIENDAEVNNLYRDLELGTVLTLYYSKKSQRPERRTFSVKLETRQIIWTRGTDKIEGESEYFPSRSQSGEKFPHCHLQLYDPMGHMRRFNYA